MPKWRSVKIFLVIKVENPESTAVVKAMSNKRWAEKEAARLSESGIYHYVTDTDLLTEHGF